jgi:Transposase, Mutator family
LQTSAGDVRLKIPKLREQTFGTAIIERYRRREGSVEEALIEMYLAGVSGRFIEDITAPLWGTPVSPSTVSKLNKKIYGTIQAWRNRPIEGGHPYVYLDGIVLKAALLSQPPVAHFNDEDEFRLWTSMSALYFPKSVGLGLQAGMGPHCLFASSTARCRATRHGS